MLIQAIRDLPYVRPPARYQNVRQALAYDVYRLWCRLKGESVAWDKEPLPEGKYILIKSVPSVGLNLLGRTYSFSEEMPVKHVPYSPELVQRLKEQTGKPVVAYEISYRLGGLSGV